MRVLLTGGTGLIGKHLGKKLVQEGHEVIVVSRSKRQAELNCPYPCVVIEGDFSKGPLNGVLPQLDAVINLAGENVAGGRWTPGFKQKLKNSRVGFTNNLVQSLNGQSSLKVFVSSSAIGFYGNSTQEASESSSAGQGFLAELCKDWEATALLARQLPSAPRTVIVRTGVVLSPFGGALEKMRMPFQMGVGSPLGGGKQWMSWIHLDDIAQIFSQALVDPSFDGIINGVSPEPVSNEDFSKILAKSFGKGLLPAVPAFLLKTALGEMSAILLDSQRVIPKVLLDNGFIFKFAKLQDALADCNKYFQGGDQVFFAEQFLKSSRQEVFPFFADAHNLERITPPLLNFRIKKVSTPGVQQGTLIDYTLKIRGVPVSWKTEIEKWDPNNYFVDNQLRGPYKKWHHSHIFADLGSGTLMTDIVRYRLPMGWIGQLVAGWYVRSDVSKIFRFRREEVGKYEFSKK